ncbi:hypothetical protein ACOME3_006174 [Neoechinorhynchus agilis]
MSLLFTAQRNLYLARKIILSQLNEDQRSEMAAIVTKIKNIQAMINEQEQINATTKKSAYKEWFDCNKLHAAMAKELRMKTSKMKNIRIFEKFDNFSCANLTYTLLEIIIACERAYDDWSKAFFKLSTLDKEYSLRGCRFIENREWRYYVAKENEFLKIEIAALKRCVTDFPQVNAVIFSLLRTFDIEKNRTHYFEALRKRLQITLENVELKKEKTVFVPDTNSIIQVLKMYQKLMKNEKNEDVELINEIYTNYEHAKLMNKEDSLFGKEPTVDDVLFGHIPQMNTIDNSIIQLRAIMLPLQALEVSETKEQEYKTNVSFSDTTRISALMEIVLRNFVNRKCEQYSSIDLSDDPPLDFDYYFTLMYPAAMEFAPTYRWFWIDNFQKDSSHQWSLRELVWNGLLRVWQYNRSFEHWNRLLTYSQSEKNNFAKIALMNEKNLIFTGALRTAIDTSNLIWKRKNRSIMNKIGKSSSELSVDKSRDANSSSMKQDNEFAKLQSTKQLDELYKSALRTLFYDFPTSKFQ